MLNMRSISDALRIHRAPAILLGVAFASIMALAGTRAAAQAPATITYELEEAGQVSAAVYDSDGQMVRELLRGEDQQAGTHELTWDGLNRAGEPVPAGQYEWRVLRTPGFKAEYVTTLGTNTPGTPDDDWVGNHGPLRAVLSDGQRIYIGTFAENVPCHIAMTIDGSEILWRGGIRLAHGKSHGMNFADDGTGMLYDLRSTGRWDAPRLFAVDPDTGDRKYFFTVEHWKARMDAGGGYAVVSFTEQDLVRWYSLGEGLAQKERVRRTWGANEFEHGPAHEAQAAALKDVAVDARGRAYVITDGAIVRLTPDGERTTIVAAEALTSPHRVAWGDNGNELLVAEREGSHQVKRFALPSGELLNTYGKQGGRPYGPYDPLAFRDINDVAPDGHGGFLIVEGGTNAMQRTARFDGEGALVDRWYGPQRFFNHASPDPGNPNRVFIASGRHASSELKVNYDTGEWEVAADYRNAKFGDGLFPGTSRTHLWHARRHDGQLYLVSNADRRYGILRVDREAGRLIPIAVGGVVRNPKRQALPAPLKAAVAHYEFDVPEREWQGFAFTWSDRNGNEKFEPEEFTVGDSGIGGGRVFIDAQWNVYGTTSEGRARLMTNDAPSAQTAPVWDINATEVLPGEKRAGLMGGSRAGVFVDNEDAVYRFSTSRGRPEDDRPAPGWPTNNSGKVRFVKWRADGELAWSVGRKADTYAARLEGDLPGGHLYQPVALLGDTHGTVVMGDRVGLPATAWTKDGLYAGYFLDRRADDGLHEAVYHYWRAPGTKNDGPMPYDMLTGGSMVELGENEVIWFPMGRNESPVYRITGWDNWQRASGKIQLNEPAQPAQGNGTGLSAAYFDNDRLEGEPVLERIDPRLWFTQRKRDRHATGQWRQKVIDGVTVEDHFSVRWEGQIEAPLSEAYEFYAFNIDNHSATMHDHWLPKRGGVRIWLDGELILEQWARDQRGRPRPSSDPIQLEAGKKYDLRIEYANWTDQPAGFSLVWGCFSDEMHRVPQRYLYPANESDD